MIQRLGLAVLPLVVAGCGAGTLGQQRAEPAPTSPVQQVIGDRFCGPAVGELKDIVTRGPRPDWLYVRGVVGFDEQRRPGYTPHWTVTGGASPGPSPAGTAPVVQVMQINEDVAAALRTELQNGRQVLVASRTIDRGDRTLLLGVAYAEGSSDVRVFGHCDAEVQEDLAGMADRSGRTVGRILSEVSSGDVSVLDGRAVAPTTAGFLGLPPDRRQIGDDTPRSVLDSLAHVRVRLVTPASWSTFPMVLCSRTGLGYSTCTRVDASGRWAPGFDLADFYSYEEPGKGLEIWALDDRGDMTRPLGRLAVLADRDLALDRPFFASGASLPDILAKGRAGDVFGLR